MEANQILTANLLDIIFDRRNKAYGAYDLRVTYPQRVKKALLIMFSIVFLVVGGTVIAMRSKPAPPSGKEIPDVVVREIHETPPPRVEPPPPAHALQPPPAAAVEKFNTPHIVPDEALQSPPPENSALEGVQIGDIHRDGPPSEFSAPPTPPGSGTGIVENKPDYDPNEIVSFVEIQAKYDGNWEGFLRRNLRPEVPVDKDAPAGRYRVEIRFVVDINGDISNVEAKTNNGYGMEEEAMRVIKKAKWIPAYQNGRHVKAYRTQIIIFEVVGND